jgi:hypothetical protein
VKAKAINLLIALGYLAILTSMCNLLVGGSIKVTVWAAGGAIACWLTLQVIDPRVRKA